MRRTLQLMVLMDKNKKHLMMKQRGQRGPKTVWNELAVAGKEEKFKLAKLRKQKDREEGKGRAAMRFETQRKLREQLYEGLKVTGAPYNLHELIDMAKNPHTPEDMKLPEEVLRMLSKIENKTHLDKLHNKTRRVATSFAARVKGTKVTPEAKRLVDGESHGDVFAKLSIIRSTNSSYRTPFHLAPVNYGSVKAKHLFGRQATVLVSHACSTSAEFPIPDRDLPEVAFLGMENLGKSTLINCLANRHVGPTDEAPGTTFECHFIDCANGLRIVDLPGYTDRVTRGTEVMTTRRLTTDYISTRATSGVLKLAVIVISDGGMDYVGRYHIRLCAEHEVPFIVCVTRTDQMRRQNLLRLVSLLLKELEDYPGCRGVHLTSAVQKLGISRLQNVLAESARIPELGHVLKTGFSMSDILPATGAESVVLYKTARGNLSTRGRRLSKLAAVKPSDGTGTRSANRA